MRLLERKTTPVAVACAHAALVRAAETAGSWCVDVSTCLHWHPFSSNAPHRGTPPNPRYGTAVPKSDARLLQRPMRHEESGMTSLVSKGRHEIGGNWLTTQGGVLEGDCKACILAATRLGKNTYRAATQAGTIQAQAGDGAQKRQTCLCSSCSNTDMMEKPGPLDLAGPEPRS